MSHTVLTVPVRLDRENDYTSVLQIPRGLAVGYEGLSKSNASVLSSSKQHQFLGITMSPLMQKNSHQTVVISGMAEVSFNCSVLQKSVGTQVYTSHTKNKTDYGKCCFENSTTNELVGYFIQPTSEKTGNVLIHPKPLSLYDTAIVHVKWDNAVDVRKSSQNLSGFLRNMGNALKCKSVTMTGQNANLSKLILHCPGIQNVSLPYKFTVNNGGKKLLGQSLVYTQANRPVNQVRNLVKASHRSKKQGPHPVPHLRQKIQTLLQPQLKRNFHIKHFLIHLTMMSRHHTNKVNSKISDKNFQKNITCLCLQMTHW